MFYFDKYKQSFPFVHILISKFTPHTMIHLKEVYKIQFLLNIFLICEGEIIDHITTINQEIHT